VLAGGLLFGLRGSSPEIIELSFEPPASGGNADEQTLRSIRKVGDLYTVTSYGDYEARLEWLDEYLGEKAAELVGRRNCSLFVTPTPSGQLLFGRNFDRPDRNPILVKSLPPGKYASFAFCPEEVTEHLRNLLAAGAAPSEDLKNKFLYSLPFYAADGINEKGLTLAIAAAPLRKINQSDARRPTFVLLFIRRALDTCQNVQEVEKLAETMSLYDKNLATISHHFLAADAEGNWLVIDYPDGAPRFTRGRNKPEARTNHFLDGGPQSAETKTSFARYQKLSEGLHSSRPPQTDIEAMALLRRVRDTTVWSVVYDPHGRGGLVAVREKYRKQYRFGFQEELR
jgi:choloylglycine hydrolase